MSKLTKASFAAKARELGIKKTHKKKDGKMGFTQAQVRRIAKAVVKGTKKVKRSSSKKSKTKTKRRRSNPKKGGNRSMGKRGFGYREGMSLAKKIALFAKAGHTVIRTDMDGRAKIENGVRGYTGFDLRDGKFKLGYIVEGWGPYAAVCGVDMGIRTLKRIFK